MMKAIIYRNYGGPEVLEYSEVPEPKLSQNSVLIKVKAASINPADLALQEGLGDSMMDAWFPVIPGWDLAGVIEATGAGVSEFSVGDEVIGYLHSEILHHGTYAEKISAPISAIVRKPRNADWAQSAGLPLAGLTAYQAIVRVLKVKFGETVLIHGASGGVGSLASQIAVAAGARVIGTASQENQKYLQSIGVDGVVYGDRMIEQVRAHAPEGVDVIFDCVGQNVLTTNNQIGKPNYRAGSIAGSAPGVTPIFARSHTGDMKSLVNLVEAGKLVVPIFARYPLESATEAQKALRQKHGPGKIILEV
jgi:NADPH:quinone reductase-like Zn-dependent oxidoreductase